MFFAARGGEEEGEEEEEGVCVGVHVHVIHA
jgi:hypothetical protein